MTPRRRPALAASLVLGLVVLTGCSDDETGQPVAARAPKDVPRVPAVSEVREVFEQALREGGRSGGLSGSVMECVVQRLRTKISDAEIRGANRAPGDYPATIQRRIDNATSTCVQQAG